ncbi:CoB--CoM heterodisulfide reductase iron-sulfur subunit A family protein [Candidatus Bathyarchaeota archaeon]|nr:MAG: CoB--CoM heterodisulfide reductase iron-sulfur subunit A family protein [Candidatus Bathyarchaeota archaeon]
MEKGLRIGVFVCHCGFNIGGVVDVPAVVEYAKTLPHVVFAKDHLYMCSSGGLALIKESIQKYKLNRLVVASCTPVTYEPAFRKACEEAGLNKYLFEMVNIREHCSWVHMHQPKEATEKTKDLIRMAVAKASYLKPQVEPELEIRPSSLVIGGGIAGMTTAMSLARQGFEVHLIEKEAELGGMLRKLYKLHPTRRDASELLKETITAIRGNKNIQLHLSTIVKEVKGFYGNFDVTLQNEKGEEHIKVGTMIVATGAEEFKPEGMYGYGNYKNVITQLELEQLLKRGELKKPEKVVMIQCVGAREKTGPRTYCSRICCITALNNALLLKDLYPNVEITILFRDIQTYGEHESLYLKALENFVQFIRYNPDKPPKVRELNGKLVVNVYDSYLGAEVELKTDLIILSTPLVQHEAGKKLASILKVPLGSDEFFLEAHPKLSPVESPLEGIYICGAAQGPKSVTESISQAYAASIKASIPMAARTVKTEAVKASVDTDICVGCGACAVSCIFNAIDLSSFSQPKIIEANCKGCGVCAAECPMGAMQLLHFKDQQIIAAIEALLKPKKLKVKPEKGNFEPVILCFACNKCAAPDLAGFSRIRYPPNIRILGVPCSGRVDMLHIFRAFINGADGVIVTGCPVGHCRYVDGNIKAKNRVVVMKESLKAIGIKPERFEIAFTLGPQKFAKTMTEFVERIKKLGPNPYRIDGGVKLV